MGQLRLSGPVSGAIEPVDFCRVDRFQPPVPEGLCRAHLEKLRASATFARAEQLRRLLEWLVSRSLSSGGEAPTEKEVGEQALHRKDYDPQTESLVRKEMSRLREKLARYYAQEGAHDRIRISNGGGYCFQFSWADPVREHSQEDGSPCLLFLPFRSQPELNADSIRLLDELLIQLGEHGGAELISPTTALSYMGRTGDVRAFAAECGADFVVEGSLDRHDSQLRTTVWFVNGRSGRTERPGRFAAPSLDELASRTATWLRERLVSAA
jgi:TolB-like protein